MNAIQRNTLMLVLAGAVSMPGLSLAADMAKEAPNSAESSAGAMPPTQESMKTMRERMWEMHKTGDPEKRKQLMEAQMKDMDAMMGERPCAMADDMGGMMVMGGRGTGMMGTSMPGGMPMHEAMEKRMDMLEKRVDMMLMMMRMQMDKPAR